MAELRLTPTSYIVLGLLDRWGEATPYDLKKAVSAGVGNLWTVQHAQLYSEPERLAAAGLMRERREAGGRRRRHYTLTAKGRRALERWQATPTGDLTELRDPGLLRLFFGADPAVIAPVQLEAHRARLAEYEALRAATPADVPAGPRLSLEAGIGHEREWVRFWSRLAGDAEGG